MLKAIRIAFLLLVLLFVSLGTWLAKARSTDWNNSLWVKIYPINGDGSEASQRYIESLEPGDFGSIEAFIAREAGRYGRDVDRPVRIELGTSIAEQPPLPGSAPSIPQVMWWSLRLRWWAGRVTDGQEDPPPDVRIFVRYYTPRSGLMLDHSLGMQKGMVGIVNAYAGRRHAEVNNVVIAHEFLHTLGATDKYDPANGLPLFPAGYAEPDRAPVFPQQYAEIMGGRIAVSKVDATIPESLRDVVVGPMTAEEIRLTD